MDEERRVISRLTPDMGIWLTKQKQTTGQTDSYYVKKGIELQIKLKKIVVGSLFYMIAGIGFIFLGLLFYDTVLLGIIRFLFIAGFVSLVIGLSFFLYSYRSIIKQESKK